MKSCCALWIIGLLPAHGFVLPKGTRVTVGRSERGRITPAAVCHYPMVLAIGIQETRDFVQTSVQHFLESLPLKITLGLGGSILLTAFARSVNTTFESGKEKALSGSLDFNKLYLCIFIDLLGDGSFLLPGIGESEDILWAPVSAFIVARLFESQALGTIDFVKELLPFSDAVPVATLAWLIQNVYPDSPVASILGLRPKKSERDSNHTN